MDYGPRNRKLLERIDHHAAHPATAELRKAAVQCLAVAQNFSNQRDELWSDGRYSAEGKRAQLAEMQAAQERQMGDARKPIDAAAKEVERLRGQIKPIELDRSGAAEMRRYETRQNMRTLPLHEQLALLLGDAADPEAVEAVLDRKPWYSGIPATEYARVKAERDERVQQGPQFRPIKALEAVIGEADAVATIARADLANIAA